MDTLGHVVQHDGPLVEKDGAPAGREGRTVLTNQWPTGALLSGTALVVDYGDR
jgi:hypothetical protein